MSKKLKVKEGLKEIKGRRILRILMVVEQIRKRFRSKQKSFKVLSIIDTTVNCIQSMILT